MWRCQAGWHGMYVPGGRDFLWFRPFLDSEYLQAQLIQNLWNLLESNKIYMDGQKHEIMAINTPPKLKLLLILKQSLILRLGGSGVASMFAICRYPVHSILLYLYVVRVSWLIPICSKWWGLISHFIPCLERLEDWTTFTEIFSYFSCSDSFSEYFKYAYG